MAYLPKSAVSLLVLALACGSLVACDGRSTDLKSGPNVSDSSYKILEVTPEVIGALRAKNASLATDRMASEVPARPEPYRIGVGDELQVRVWTPVLQSKSGDSEWVENPPLPVRSDGNITLPLIGDVLVEGKTLVEARASLDEVLSNYYKNWQSRLEITRYGSKEAYVLGAVKEPGPIAIKAKPISVLRAITTAGGVTDAADLSRVELLHADGTKDVLNLVAAMQGKPSTMHKIYLADGDRLTLTTTNANRAFVLGEVKQPKLVTLRLGTVSVMEMLTSADGFDAKTASYANVYVIRGVIDPSLGAAGADDQVIAATLASQKPDPLSSTIYRLDLTNAMGLAMAGQFPIEPMDIVYVSPSAISRWSEFINGILPISSTLLLNAVVTQ